MQQNAENVQIYMRAHRVLFHTKSRRTDIHVAKKGRKEKYVVGTMKTQLFTRQESGLQVFSFFDLSTQ